MADEERQRTMDFIVNTLANISVVQERTELERKADAVRIGRLEESFVTLTRLTERLAERADEHETRITGVEQAIDILTRIVSERRGGQSEA